MYGSLDEIRLELEQMEYELEQKLHEKRTAPTSTTILGTTWESERTTSTINDMYDDEKAFIVTKHIKNDLDDVRLAIMKMDLGVYGICESSGEKIPIDKLKILPTARSLSDLKFTYI